MNNYFQHFYNIEQIIPSFYFGASGEEFCKPNHSNGPKIREHYLFHFIVSGKGIFKINDKTYTVQKNQGFLIPDSSVIYYKADSNDPWHYCWFNIKGQLADELFTSLGLNHDNPIYNAKDNNNIYEYFVDLIEKAIKYKKTEYSVLQSLFALFNQLQLQNKKIVRPINNDPIKNHYIKSAVDYIINNYHDENLHINNIAQYLNIDRSYFTRIFTKQMGISPQQFLINVRMTKARDLIKSTQNPINTIAYSVGYEDAFTFSKIYKKHFGVSPRIDKKQK